MKDVLKGQYNEEEIEQQLETVLDMHQGFKLVAIKSAGEIFGELALKYDILRTATCVSKSQTICGVISRETYLRIVDQAVDQVNIEKTRFLQNVQLFKNIPFKVYQGIMYEMKLAKYEQNGIVYDEGDEAENIYFVKSGEIELSRLVAGEDRPGQMPGAQSSPNLKKARATMVINNSQKKEKRILISRKSEFQWFGETEIIQKTSRTTRAQCISPKGELYYIKKSRFFYNLNSMSLRNQLFRQSEILTDWQTEHYNR